MAVFPHGINVKTVASKKCWVTKNFGKSLATVTGEQKSEWLIYHLMINLSEFNTSIIHYISNT